MFGPENTQGASIGLPTRSILSPMRLARILGAVGRALISAGVIVLLFVAYQLWGTGLQHSAAQDNLGNDFEEQTGIEVADTDVQSLAEAARASQAALEEGQIFAADDSTVLTSEEDAEAGDDGGQSSSPDFSDSIVSADLLEANFDETERQEIQAKLYPDAGEPLARVVIPAINVDQITVEGVSVEDLRMGPGHYQTTPNPGQAGNSAIAGHRTTYGAPFHRVDELKPGDPIFVTTVQGVFEYRVLPFDNPAGGDELGYFIVSPSDTWVLDQKPDQNLLTLTACHPKYSARQRIIVQAELVGEPAPTIPRDEAVDLGAVTLDSGATDERAAEADAVEAIPEEEQQIISDEVAADDDPSVDADGNPIDDADGDSANSDTEPADTDDDDADGDSANSDTEPATDDDDADGDSANSDAEPATDENDAEAAGAPANTDGDEAEAMLDEMAEDADEAEGILRDASENIELTSAQTPFSTDDFGEGLNGDPTKVRPAIMWGISGLFVWLAAWFMGQRLDRKWTMYAVALAPFAFVLWSTFVNVDQALPSY